MGAFKFIKELTAEKLAVVTSLFGAGIIVLASESIYLALTAGITFITALTAASAVTSAVRYLTSDIGRLTVYTAVFAGICAVAVILVSDIFFDIYESFFIIAAIMPVSAAVTENRPERESVIYGAVRSFAIGVIYALIMTVLAAVRSLLGLDGVWAGMILLGVSYAVLKAIFGYISEKRKREVQNADI